MTNEWPRHEFLENAKSPEWCIKCGRHADHQNHKRPYQAWVRKMAQMLKKPPWTPFG